MAVTKKIIYQGVLTTSTATLYEVNSETDEIVLITAKYLGTAASKTLTLYYVPEGASAADANVEFNAHIVQKGKTNVVWEAIRHGHALTDGYTIQGKCSENNKVQITITARVDDFTDGAGL